jgi:hypothetical protein
MAFVDRRGSRDVLVKASDGSADPFGRTPKVGSLVAAGEALGTAVANEPLTISARIPRPMNLRPDLRLDGWVLANLEFALPCIARGSESINAY